MTSKVGDERLIGLEGEPEIFYHSSVTMVAHFVCILFTGFMIYTSSPGTSLFSWHPTLMTIAFMLLMAQGILVFSPLSSILLKSERSVKVKFHWITMVSALACATGGVFVIWYNKELNGSPHMTSWHGTLGYATVLYVIIQCMAGTIQLYPQIAMKYIKLIQLKMMHATSGTVLYLLACCTLILGLYSNWFTGLVTGTSWYTCAVCPVILLTIAVNQVTAAYLKPPRK